MSIKNVILTQGVSCRLWPLSAKLNPKQSLQILKGNLFWKLEKRLERI